MINARDSKYTALNLKYRGRLAKLKKSDFVLKRVEVRSKKVNKVFEKEAETVREKLVFSAS